MNKIFGNVIMFIVFVVIAIGAKCAVKKFISGDSYSLNLAQVASDMNKDIPMNIDKITRLDATAARSKDNLMYRYTLLAEEFNMSGEEFKKVMFPKLVNSYQTTPTMEIYRKHNIKLTYSYYDLKGKHFSTIDVQTSDFETAK